MRTGVRLAALGERVDGLTITVDKLGVKIDRFVDSMGPSGANGSKGRGNGKSH